MDVGTYEDPVEREPAPIDHVVADGMLIATSAVRMAVKNRLIVAALRENDDYDPEALAVVASAELEHLAEQNEESAARVWQDGTWTDEPSDGERNQRKRDVFTGLARVLRDAAADPEQLRSIVDQARDAAWDEIGAVIETKLVVEPEIVPDAAYEREREGRIRALKEVDIAGLETFLRYRDLLN